MTPSSRPWLDRAAVVGFGGLFALALGRLGAAASHAPTAVLLGLAGLWGYALADAVSGAVHWLADRYFDPETPLLGPLLIREFRAHHERPEQITRLGFFESTGMNALVSLPPLAGLLWLGPPRSPSAAAAQALVLGLLLGAFWTTRLHAWAHVAEPPRAVRWLQRLGLVLSPERHAHHHVGHQDRSYCVTSGWLNPLLDGLEVFRRLERMLERAGAPPPRREDLRAR